jgi:hypothetical protein
MNPMRADCLVTHGAGPARACLAHLIGQLYLYVSGLGGSVLMFVLPSILLSA